MFAVIYRFNVRPGHNASFEMAWHELTESIFEHSGSLGSRLHKESESTYIAYAQWPARDIWSHESDLPESANTAKKEMNEACSAIDSLYCLEVVDDLLVEKTFSEAS
jgi:quinol monooxygenase YgiN